MPQQTHTHTQTHTGAGNCSQSRADYAGRLQCMSVCGKLP